MYSGPDQMFIDKENGVWHMLRSSIVQNNGAIVQTQTHDDYDECARHQSNKNASKWEVQEVSSTGFSINSIHN